MCRVLGIVANGDVLTHVILGLHMQNYAGEHSTGIASLRDGNIIIRRSLGKAIDIFSHHDTELASEMIIGHDGCSASEIQPIKLVKKGQPLAFTADTSKEATVKIREKLRNASNILSAVKNILRTVGEPFALVVLSPEYGLIAARNSGIKPLTIGRIDIDGLTGFYVSSQSGVVLKGKFIKTVEPGDLTVINRESYYDIHVLGKVDRRHCINEDLYRQRPGNISGKREVSNIRIDIGRKLGEKFARELESLRLKYGVDAEFKAIPILEGGRLFTIGFAQTSGIPTDPTGSVRNVYSVPSEMRRMAKSIGLSDNFYLQPIPDIEEKVIVLIDDQIRSGDKIKHMAKQCRLNGAADVLAVVGSLGRSNCHYGDAAYDEKSMVGRKGISIKRICKKLGISGLIFLSLGELVEAINSPERFYCVECLS